MVILDIKISAFQMTKIALFRFMVLFAWLQKPAIKNQEVGCVPLILKVAP